MRPGVKAGLIGAAVSIVFSLFSYFTNSDTDFSNKWLNHVFIILPAILGVVLAKRESEEMTFKMGFQAAIQAALVCGILYSAYFILYLTVLRPEFTDLLMNFQMAEMEKKGMTQEQMDQAMPMIKKFMSIPFMIGTSIIMYAFYGAIVGAITAGFMRSKNNS